ncbi:MAG: ABC transporter ATP-binding protein [Balneolia bacterium]|nr:ABC transporter ATP-binding protein [Balneolia bacterium]
MISVDNISYSYKGKQPLFSGLSLETRPDTIYGLFGLNSAGKTTLLKLISGLLYPDSGSCTVLGAASSQRKPSILSSMFFLPEQFELPLMSAKTYIKLYAPFYPNFDAQQLADLLAFFDLNLNENLRELSLGQQKKFLIAFGLAANTKVLLLDEPTNGLDIPGKSQFRKALASHVTEERSVIISTHQIRDLGQTMDHIIILHEGEILLNTDLINITKKLSTVQMPEADAGRLIYSEPSLGGVKGLISTDDIPEHQAQEFDMELFFNAATRQPEKIKHNLQEVTA